jgi:hypothetical protein
MTVNGEILIQANRIDNASAKERFKDLTVALRYITAFDANYDERTASMILKEDFV